jgi:SAM-dependent methyltransferase
VSTYLFEHTWDQERRRLELLETVFDGATQAYLSPLGLPHGARCLEVGAGAGSIARWLCERVGPGGRVVATDLDTGFLEMLAEENLEVRRHDIVADDLETGAFDLIHSRLVLEHLPERDDVLRRLAAALRPGGWLVVEDFDWGSLAIVPGGVAADLLERAHEAARRVFTAAGYDCEHGRQLPGALAAAGLVDVGAEGRVYVGVPGSPARAWWGLNMAKLGPAFVETGVLSADEVDQLLEHLDDEDLCFQLPTLVTAWGRRPG